MRLNAQDQLDELEAHRGRLLARVRNYQASIRSLNGRAASNRRNELLQELNSELTGVRVELARVNQLIDDSICVSTFPDRSVAADRKPIFLRRSPARPSA